MSPDRYDRRWRRCAFLPIAFLAALFIGIPVGVRAASFTVSSTGDDASDPTTLRGAVAASEASADVSDTIMVTVNGTISVAPNGPLNVYNGRNVAGKTLTITGPGSAKLALDGGGQSGVVAICDNGTGSLTVSLSGVTISGGANSSGGAGISTTEAFNLTGVTLSGNTTTDSLGGGLYAGMTDVTLTDCTVSGNAANYGIYYAAGGGLCSDGGTLTITDSAITGNNGCSAGGIYTTGRTTITDCLIAGNTSTQNGGGVYNADGSLTVTGSTLSANTAADNGGGVYDESDGGAGEGLGLAGCTVSGNAANDGAGAYLSLQNTGDGARLSASVVSSTFSGNTAQGRGGALYCGAYDISMAGGLLSTSLTNCTFSGNRAVGDSGGGLYIDSEDYTGGGTAVMNTTLTNCTVSGNTAFSNGGIDFHGYSGNGAGPVCTVVSSLIAGNFLTNGSSSDADILTDGFSPVTSGGSNLIGIGDADGDFLDGASQDHVGTAGSPLDPHLGTLADNGGPTQTLALLTGSPAFDADYNGASNGLTTDERGLPRPVGMRNDIGAFEHQSPAAAAHAYTAAANVTKTVSVPGVLAGAGIPDAASMAAVLLCSGPAHGALTLNADGSFTYTPSTGFTGTDTFTYAVNDGLLVSAPATVTLTVQSVLDVTAPVTTASASGPAGSGGWYTGLVTVTLAATDDASGVAATVYSLDGGPQTPYTAPVAVAGDGSHALAFHSTDSVGNLESTKSLTVRIDGAKPTLTFGSPSPAPNAAGWDSANVTLPYAASDTTSGVATASPAGPLAFAAEGANQTQAVTVTDAAGNSRTFTSPPVSIDRTAPATTGSASPVAGGQAVTLSAVDALSGVASTVYSVDGGASQAYAGPFTLSASHTVAFHSVDNAGNAEGTKTLGVDASAPTTVAAKQSTVIGERVTLTATDDFSGVSATVYSVDGGAQKPYTGPITITGNGSHTVAFHSTDRAGNAEATKTADFTINIAAPITTASATGPLGQGGWYTGAVTVTLAAASAASTVAATVYSVDSGAQKPYVGPFSVSGDGAHTVAFRSTDTAGNTEAADTLTLKIDATAPATRASAAGTQGAGGVYTGPVTVTLSASDAASGVSATAYSVDGGPQTAYTTPLTISSEGGHTVTFGSTDDAGNQEAAHTLALSVRLPATAPAVPAVAHTFAAGLQMVSTPADYSAVPLGTAFSAGAPRLAVWDPSSLLYDLTPSALRPGQGYSARFGQADALYDLGTPTPTAQPFSISLKKGWNMIGDPFPSSVSLSAIQVTAGGKSYAGLSAAMGAGAVAPTLYGYPAGASAYQTEGGGGTLAPYAGYWIYAFSDASLAVPAP